MSSRSRPIVCKGCGNVQAWIPIYRRYYCFDCKTYPPTCPKCSSDLSWIREYERYYCYTCEEYPEFKAEAASIPTPQISPAEVLVKTSHRPRFFASILNAIDRFCVVVQKGVGGFPRGDLPTSSSIFASHPAPARREQRRYLMIGVFLILIASCLLFFVSWLAYFSLFLFSFIGPGLYLFWIWRSDRYEREPKIYVFIVFAMGFFTTIGAYVLNSWIVGPYLGGLSAPIVEEVLKGLCVLWVARKQEFNDAMDGIVYGFVAGMGFAASENFFYIIEKYELNLIASAFRVFIWAFGHGLYTSMTGRWMGKMKVLTGAMRNRYVVPGLIVAIVWHFIYNEIASTFLPIFGNIAWDVFCLLIVLAAVRQALTDERQWGYDKGLAPAGASIA